METGNNRQSRNRLRRKAMRMYLQLARDPTDEAMAVIDYQLKFVLDDLKEPGGPEEAGELGFSSNIMAFSASRKSR
jgi:hypothetical protein